MAIALKIFEYSHSSYISSYSDTITGQKNLDEELEEAEKEEEEDETELSAIYRACHTL